MVIIRRNMSANCFLSFSLDMTSTLAILRLSTCSHQTNIPKNKLVIYSFLFYSMKEIVHSIWIIVEFVNTYVNNFKGNDLIKLIIQNIKNDLSSRNPVHVNLALHCIANVGTPEMAEAFFSEIPKLLISKEDIDSVKQRLALEFEK